MPKQFDNSQLTKQIQEDMKNVTPPPKKPMNNTMVLCCGNINCGAYIGEIDFPILYVHLKAKCPKCGLVNELKRDHEMKAGMQIDWSKSTI